MRKVEAFIAPVQLQEVSDALRAAGIRGMTVSECSGLGDDARRRAFYRGAAPTLEPQPRIKIELVVSAEEVENAVEAIGRAGRGGLDLDGTVAVFQVPEAVRIRTDERGPRAI
jgi:nitrogen regulatory protein P-II 1